MKEELQEMEDKMVDLENETLDLLVKIERTSQFVATFIGILAIGLVTLLISITDVHILLKIFVLAVISIGFTFLIQHSNEKSFKYINKLETTKKTEMEVEDGPWNKDT